jgi:hypothetical protein
MVDELALAAYGNAYLNQVAMGTPVYHTDTGTFTNAYNPGLTISASPIISSIPGANAPYSSPPSQLNTVQYFTSAPVNPVSTDPTLMIPANIVSSIGDFLNNLLGGPTNAATNAVSSVGTALNNNPTARSLADTATGAVNSVGSDLNAGASSVGTAVSDIGKGVSVVIGDIGGALGTGADILGNLGNDLKLLTSPVALIAIGLGALFIISRK